MRSQAVRTPRRSYDQYCAVARGLDVIGDRWTLLLVRDLLLGPKRYKDLLSGLPGIGTNLLAARLKELEAAGLIERTVLPPPAGSAVYQLTETGQSLETVMTALGRWGARFLGPPKKTDVMVPRAYFVAMRGVFNPEAAAGITLTYEVRIGDLVFEVRVADGRLTTREGAVRNPDVVLSMEVETLNALMFHTLTPAAALASGRVKIGKGDLKALERFIAIVGFHRPG
ncbi:MAG: transcriptional regulator [Chloroflexi bacterium]|nr:MAG: transcriptional regulator [Chloroflexota bacterium]